MLSEDICSQSVLSRIENNEELPNVLVMQQLCDRLGVTVDQIMRYKSGDVHVVTYSFEKWLNIFAIKISIIIKLFKGKSYRRTIVFRYGLAKILLLFR